MRSLSRAACIAALVCVLGISVVSAESPPSEGDPTPAATPYAAGRTVHSGSGDAITTVTPDGTPFTVFDPDASDAEAFGAAGAASVEVQCFRATHRYSAPYDDVTLIAKVRWCATTVEPIKIHGSVETRKDDSRGAHWQRESLNHSVRAGGHGAIYVDTEADGSWCYEPPQLGCTYRLWMDMDTEQNADGVASARGTWRSASQ